jgi:hypothetical protein
MPATQQQVAAGRLCPLARHCGVAVRAEAQTRGIQVKTCSYRACHPRPEVKRCVKRIQPGSMHAKGSRAGPRLSGQLVAGGEIEGSAQAPAHLKPPARVEPPQSPSRRRSVRQSRADCARQIGQCGMPRAGWQSLGPQCPGKQGPASTKCHPEPDGHAESDIWASCHGRRDMSPAVDAGKAKEA